MAQISQLATPEYSGMVSGDAFQAHQWNSYVELVTNKINELVNAVNGNTQGGGTSPSPIEPKPEDKLYVNGTVVEPVEGKVMLDAFGQEGYPSGGYVISGTLTGQIIIGSADYLPLDDTLIVLNGVTIKTSSIENAAIMYMPADQCLNVTLAKNKENYLICSNVAERQDSQKGALWSENNMIVQGNGYLAIKNLGGHGIKASKLHFFGNPHVYVDAIHDAIHGNSMLDLVGGVYYLTKANDAFGTRVATEDKLAGVIRVFKAEIYAYGIADNVFDSKGEGYIFNGLSLYTDTPTSRILSGITYADPKVLFGKAVRDTTNGGYTQEPVGTVKCYTDKDMTLGETTIESVDGTYTLTTKYAKISGYVAGKVVTSIQSTDIALDGYLEGNIEYTATKKKLQINVEKDTIGIIEGNVISMSNLAIEVKSNANFLVTGNVMGDELTFNDSKGVALILGNVQGKDVYVGTQATTDTSKYLNGAVIIDGTMKTILNSKFNKGWLHVLSSNLIGVFCAKRLDIAGWADLDNSYNVFFNEAKGIIVGTKTIEDTDHISV